jgi:signal transduction histidine kinase
MKHLYWRLYLTLLAVTLVALFAVGVAFRALGAANAPPAERLRHAAGVLGQAVPELSLPEETDRLVELADELSMDLAVWNERGEPVATAVERPFPPPRRLGPGWRHARPGLELVMAIGPDRYLGVRPRLHAPNRFHPFFLALIALAVLVGVGSYPVARRITRRLEALEGGVARWGAGELGHRVAVQGDDEVASLAASFNAAAGQVEALVAQQGEMLASTSHQLRSPLARLRMGLELLGEENDPERRARLIESGRRDVRDLDALIEQVLLMARADGRVARRPFETVDLRPSCRRRRRAPAPLASGGPVSLSGDAVMLRHLVRNLLENAQRHGGGKDVRADVAVNGDDVVLAVEDRGPASPRRSARRSSRPSTRAAARPPAAAASASPSSSRWPTTTAAARSPGAARVGAAASRSACRARPRRDAVAAPVIRSGPRRAP